MHERGNNCDVFYNECELSLFPLKPFKCILSVERFLKPDCSYSVKAEKLLVYNFEGRVGISDPVQQKNVLNSFICIFIQ